jgi:RNA polymerase sigma factor (sigma-70 family)
MMAAPDLAPETRPSLLLRLRDSGDTQAWNTFVAIYGPLVYGECRRRSLKHDDAEDVTQKVFTRVCSAIRNFDYEPARGSFRDWLGIIVRNEVFRFQRAMEEKTRGDSGLEDLPGAQPSPEWSAAFHDHLLRAALDRCRPHFEPSTWDAFQRVWLLSQQAGDVARELGQPVDWVYVAKSRVLKRLEQIVRELAEDWPLPDV